MSNTYERTTTPFAGGQPVRFTYHIWAFDENGNGQTIDWKGGDLTFGVAVGAFMGSGTLRFQWSPDGTNFLNMSDPFTAGTDPLQTLILAPGKIILGLSGATSPVFNAVLGEGIDQKAYI